MFWLSIFGTFESSTGVVCIREFRMRYSSVHFLREVHVYAMQYVPACIAYAEPDKRVLGGSERV